MDYRVLRESAFRALFQLEFNRGETEEYENNEQLAVETATAEIEDVKPSDLQKILKKVRGTHDNVKKIDELISANLKAGWNFSRLALTDRNILRLAVYEMNFAGEEKLPPGIAINEAVELAKKYGSSDDSGKFVNGVLAAISGTRKPRKVSASEKVSKTSAK